MNSPLPHVTLLREKYKKGSCWFDTVDINFLNYPLMVKSCDGSQARDTENQNKIEEISNPGINLTFSFLHWWSDCKKKRVENRKSDCTSERGQSWKLIKNKQKGSIRARGKGLTRGYGHELLKLIPDVWELSAMSSRRRPTRLRRSQNCKIAILLDKANISIFAKSPVLYFLLKLPRQVSRRHFFMNF